MRRPGFQKAPAQSKTLSPLVSSFPATVLLLYSKESRLVLETTKDPLLMDAEEIEVSLYLKGWPGQFVSLAQITRRAVSRKRYNREPNWAVPVLSRMVEKGILESDSGGHYRLKPQQKKQKPARWASPEIRRILRESGKDFSGVFDLGDVDDPAYQVQPGAPQEGSG